MLLQRLFFFIYIFNTDIKHHDESLLFAVAVIYNLQKKNGKKAKLKKKRVFSYHVRLDDETYLYKKKNVFNITNSININQVWGRGTLTKKS